MKNVDKERNQKQRAHKKRREDIVQAEKNNRAHKENEHSLECVHILVFCYGFKCFDVLYDFLLISTLCASFNIKFYFYNETFC